VRSIISVTCSIRGLLLVTFNQRRAAVDTSILETIFECDDNDPFLQDIQTFLANDNMQPVVQGLAKPPGTMDHGSANESSGGAAASGSAPARRSRASTQLQAVGGA
jgi:hypothetical protein